MIDVTKICTRCGIEKDVSDYHKRSSRCKVCVSELDKARYKKNPDGKKASAAHRYSLKTEEIKEYARTRYASDPDRFRQERAIYRINNPEKVKKIHRVGWLRRSYNLTTEEYAFILESQNGCCGICKVPASQLKINLSVDHDHSCCPSVFRQ